jgi:predicted polyphosphate/ATP-dependent NAD kinase
MLERLAQRAGGSERVVVVHGGAAGLDSMAGVLARHMGMSVEVHYAEWQKHGRSAGVIRNQEMVNRGADLIVAYPLPGGRGTQDCIERGVKAGIPTLVYNASTGEYERR